MAWDPTLSTLPPSIRFLLLGGLAAAINWLARFPLSAILPFEVAVAAAYVIGMSAGFVLYRRYVFPGSTRPLGEQSLMFLGVNLFGAVVVLALTSLFLSLLSVTGWPLAIREGLAHGAAIGFGAIANFYGHKTITFARTGSSADGNDSLLREKH
jgi:putative flippase GtrA